MTPLRKKDAKHSVQQNEHIDLFARCVFANAYIVYCPNKSTFNSQTSSCLSPIVSQSGSTINPFLHAKTSCENNSFAKLGTRFQGPKKTCLQALERVYPSNGPSGNAAKHWCCGRVVCRKRTV